MSAVPALDSVDNGVSGASLSLLQDVLYDIIATDGADGDVAVEHVERFLHEHARTPLSREAFVAFFEAHDLSTHVTPTMLGEDSPALTQSMTPQTVHTGGFTPVAVEPPSLPSAAAGVEVARRAHLAGPVLWAVAAFLVLVMGVMIGVGYQALTGLRGELRHARSVGATQQQVIERLEDRTSTLQAGLSDSLERIRSVDDREQQLEALLPMPVDMPAGGLSDAAGGSAR